MKVHTLRLWVLFLEENKESQRALKYKIFPVPILATCQHLPEDLIDIFLAFTDALKSSTLKMDGREKTTENSPKQLLFRIQ